jgi:formylglycine-generating enzyme required for sulfatase activity
LLLAEQSWHPVRIIQPFYLAVHEVTVGQFRQFVESAKYNLEAERPRSMGTTTGWDRVKKEFVKDPRYTWDNPGFPQADDEPVVNVSWNDARAFCDWLTNNDPSGFSFRLPKEAEWEYACRAGSTTLFAHGNGPEGLVAVANVVDESTKRKIPTWKSTIEGDDGHEFTAPVGWSKKPNTWGLYDMIGNVWEWCQDRDDPGYDREPPADPPDPKASASFRVFRGGGWSSDAGGCRPASRRVYPPENRYCYVGFRVAATKD